MKNRFFSHFLTLLFLLAFSFEVITGLTINPDSESAGSAVSSKNSSLHFFDFFWEELSESEQETSEVRHANADHLTAFAVNQFLFFDFTRLVGQYHAKLHRSLHSVPIYRFVHTWLI